MPQADAQPVKTAVAHLQATLDGEAEALALAHLYRSHELYADAIALLEAYRQAANPPSIAVAHLLADLCWEVELWQQAEALYLQVLEQYRQAEDLDGEVTVLSQLAAFYGALLGPTNAKTIAYQAQLQRQRQTLGMKEP
ncbi:hypothetical protein [Trichothermofontia sp.]